MQVVLRLVYVKMVISESMRESFLEIEFKGNRTWMEHREESLTNEDQQQDHLYQVLGAVDFADGKESEDWAETRRHVTNRVTANVLTFLRRVDLLYSAVRALLQSRNFHV